MEAAASPLPSEDTTPPVTKMYFADIVSSPQLCLEICAGWCARSIMTEGNAEGNGQIRLRASGFRRQASGSEPLARERGGPRPSGRAQPVGESSGISGNATMLAVTLPFETREEWTSPHPKERLEGVR